MFHMNKTTQFMYITWQLFFIRSNVKFLTFLRNVINIIKIKFIDYSEIAIQYFNILQRINKNRHVSILSSLLITIFRLKKGDVLDVNFRAIKYSVITNLIFIFSRHCIITRNNIEIFWVVIHNSKNRKKFIMNV